MNRNAIRWVIVLGILSIVGIISVQVYFIHKAFDQEDRKLNQTLTIALREVVEEMARYNDSDPPHQDPVIRINSDYYIVNVNGLIDPVILEHFLIRNLNDHGIKLDFEYGIYDCQTDQMVFGSLVRFGEQSRFPMDEYEFERVEGLLYYFGIYFPGLSNYLFQELGIWYFFSFILLLVVIFFGYTQFVILKQKRYAEIQRDFINTMTHEFKTPLASLTMASEVIRGPDIVREPDRLHQYGTIIGEQVSHLLNQVDAVLSAAGPLGGGVLVQLEEIDMRKEVEAVLRLIDPGIHRNNARIDVVWHTDETRIRADGVHFRNMLFNLLDNGLKYGGEAPTIQIELKKPGKRRYLIVQDNGPGIPEKYQKRVFERFFRVPTGNVHDVKGFGLGLFYVRSVVKAHRWKIKLDSKHKPGTRIILTLPE